MNVEHLVRMANDIGDFFKAEAGPDAPASIANHLQRFWDVRMRKAIIEYARMDGTGLAEPVRQAVSMLGGSSRP